MLRLVGESIGENIDDKLTLKGYNRLLCGASCDVEELDHGERSLVVEARIEDLHDETKEGRCTTIRSRFHLREQVDSCISHLDLGREEICEDLRVTLQEVFEDLNEDYGVSLRQVFRANIAGILDLFKELL